MNVVHISGSTVLCVHPWVEWCGLGHWNRTICMPGVTGWSAVYSGSDSSAAVGDSVNDTDVGLLGNGDRGSGLTRRPIAFCRLTCAIWYSTPRTRILALCSASMKTSRAWCSACCILISSSSTECKLETLAGKTDRSSCDDDALCLLFGGGWQPANTTSTDWVVEADI